jgi:hypothetical protein
MEKKLEQLIKEKVILLVDFILENNPNVNRDHIYHKLDKLNLLPMSKTKVSTVKLIKNEPKRKIINSIMENKPIIKVKRSLFSNHILFIDNDDNKFDDLKKNKFVIDIRSKTIIGIENFEGKIEPLDKSLIEICHKYKIKYKIPLNLNINDNLEQDVIITNEIQELGLNYAESEAEEEEECKDEE